MKDDTALILLEDGESFGGAEGSLVLLYNEADLPEDIGSDGEEGAAICEGIEDGDINGTVVSVSGLLKLRELVGELEDNTLADPEKRQTFMDAVFNLDIWD